MLAMMTILTIFLEYFNESFHVVQLRHRPHIRADNIDNIDNVDNVSNDDNIDNILGRLQLIIPRCSASSGSLSTSTC